MRPSLGRSGLALVAWLGLIVHLGASACGSLLCGLGQSSPCCAMAAHAGEDEDPGHTVQRAPCGCCEDEAHACATAVAPVMAAEQARVPVASLWALAPAPVAVSPMADRMAEPPAWWARPPPIRPAATSTIVLLL